MRAQVAVFVDVVVAFRGPPTEGLFLVYVCLTHADSDGKDGNVHHDEVRDLDSRVQVGNGNYCKTSGSSSSCLKQAI